MITPESLRAAHNEQAKLTATGFNNVAVGLVLIGVVTPVVGASFGLPTAPALSETNLAIVAGWLLGASILHLVARLVLLRMK